MSIDTKDKSLPEFFAGELNAAYNQGIDEAIEVVKVCHEKLPYYTSQVSTEPMIQEIIKKLESLKK